MPANLAMDDKLLEKAQKIGGLKTKKDTVTLALKEFIQRRQQEKIIDYSELLNMWKIMITKKQGTANESS